MDYTTEKEFRKLGLIKKYEAVSERGYYIAKRRYRGMEAYLYKVDDFYVEVWKRYMRGEINWIEVAPEDVFSKYIDFVNINNILQKH